MELKDYDCESEHDAAYSVGSRPYRHSEDLSIKCSVLSLVVGSAKSHTDKPYSIIRRQGGSAVFVWCLLGAARV
jgi:hypothetical protein